MSDSATEQQEPRVIRWSVRRQWTYDDSTTWWVDSWDEVVGPFMYEETAARIAEMLNALESELKTLRA
jgi:transposase-like protein